MNQINDDEVVAPTYALPFVLDALLGFGVLFALAYALSGLS